MSQNSIPPLLKKNNFKILPDEAWSQETLHVAKGGLGLPPATEVAYTRLTSMKRLTNLNLDVIVMDMDYNVSNYVF